MWIRMKHRLSWLCLFLVVATVSAQPPSEGILWKIEKAGVTASYLLATIHSEDPNVLKIADAIKPQLDATKSFTAELDLNMIDAMQATLAMMISDGKDLPGLIGQARYAKSLPLLAAYGIPDLMAREMKPWAVAVTLSMPKPQTGLFLDQVLFTQAQQQNKATYGLETFDEQLNIFDKLTLQQQIVLLDDALENHPKLAQQLTTLINLYITRDLTAMKKYADSLNQKSDPELIKAMEKTLLVDRNLRMVERMQVRLLEGNAFIAVGALHLPGEKGLLRLLQNRGYAIKPVY